MIDVQKFKGVLRVFCPLGQLKIPHVCYINGQKGGLDCSPLYMPSLVVEPGIEENKRSYLLGQFNLNTTITTAIETH